MTTPCDSPRALAHPNPEPSLPATPQTWARPFQQLLILCNLPSSGTLNALSEGLARSSPQETTVEAE